MNEVDEPARDGHVRDRVPRQPVGQVSVEANREALGSRIHGYTLLFVVGVVQLGWLATLAYALMRLFS